MNVTADFLGRLGNLMFITSAMIGYCKRTGQSWGIPPHYHHRQIYKFWKLPIYKGNIKRLPVYDVATDEGWGYKEIPHHPNGVKLRGFFQSYRHFENATEEVKQAFRLNINPIDAVSIHVRRGDYVQNANTFPPIDMNYLHQAVDIFRQYGKMKFIVFSDDIPWCRANLPQIKDAEFQFIEGRNEFQDLSLMASCSDHCIANSTFSWWGAWLGHNPDKIVVTPSEEPPNWFGHNKMDTTHLLPKEWVKIKFR